MKHGYAVHGKNDPTWYCWRNMRQRCCSSAHPQWEHYGGRGIKVCARWEAFTNFLADMGERPAGLSLDRIDNNRGYSKANCRWTTAKVQVRNRRNNVILHYRGNKYAQVDLPKVIGISTITLLRGIGSLGWTKFRKRIYSWEAKGRPKGLLPVRLISVYR